ncbi:unnamed protein product, partial [Didymodactylos carnosus]
IDEHSIGLAFSHFGNEIKNFFLTPRVFESFGVFNEDEANDTDDEYQSEDDELMMED